MTPLADRAGAAEPTAPAVYARSAHESPCRHALPSKAGSTLRWRSGGWWCCRRSQRPRRSGQGRQWPVSNASCSSSFSGNDGWGVGFRDRERYRSARFFRSRRSDGWDLTDSLQPDPLRSVRMRVARKPLCLLIFPTHDILRFPPRGGWRPQPLLTLRRVEPSLVFQRLVKACRSTFSV